MARYKEPFTLYKRRSKKNVVVWYYRCYSPDGERTCGRSTGQTSKTLARHFCQDLIAAGVLWTGKAITFRQFAEHFFDDNSQWMLEKNISGTCMFSVNTISSYRRILKNYLLPYFGKYKIIDIKPSLIKKFRIDMSGDGLKNRTINNYVSVLGSILKVAVADGLISIDPMTSISALPEMDSKKVDAFTRDEIISMFNKEWKKTECKIFALTGALTGMRICEILSIRKENLFENYIDLKDQVINHKLQPLKTKVSRYVPIPNQLYPLLKSLIKEDFCFTHIDDYYRLHFINDCGVSDMSEKGLRFHSLRHFVNTDMLVHNIPENKVRAVLGHSEGKGTMTDRYTNWRPEMFPEVYQWQTELMKSILENKQ